jgi:hypothetical protein
VQAGAVTGPSSRVPLLLAVWLGGLLAATSVGLLAVRLVAAQVGDPAVAPLSAVAAASAAASPSGGPAPTPSGVPSSAPTTSAPSTSGTGTSGTGTSGTGTSGTGTSAPATAAPPSVAAATTRTLTTAAGTLGVQCVATGLRLLYATPAQGWALDERAVSGPEAEVRFAGAGTRMRVRVSCATGAPQLVEQRTDRDGEDDDRDDDRGDEGGGDEDGADDD